MVRPNKTSGKGTKVDGVEDNLKGETETFRGYAEVESFIGSTTKPTIVSLANRTFYFYPPDKREPMVLIISQSQARDPEGEFQKTYRHYEARNWTINEHKKEEVKDELPQIHPQTGKPIG